MPRDNDKNNDSSRGRRDRPSGGKGRSGAARGPDKKFAKRGFAGKSDGDKRPYTPRPDGEKRPYAGKSDGAKSYGKKPYSGPGKPYAGKREGPPPRRDYGDRAAILPTVQPGRPRRRAVVAIAPIAARARSFARATIAAARSVHTRRVKVVKNGLTPRVVIAATRAPAARFADKKFGDKRPYTPRGEGGEKRPYTPRGEGFRKDGDRPRRPALHRRPRWRPS